MMDLIRSFFIKQFNRVGYLGIFLLSDAYLNLIQALMYAYYGCTDRVIDSGIWGLGLVIFYYTIDYYKNKDDE
ncbi:MAG: hypothetical protein N2645_13890 [Clostridia bacterium]|nr:hypothetical protein [Clostridia bacterium]